MMKTKQYHKADEELKRFELRMPESMYWWLKELAEANGNSMALQILIFLEEKLLKENEADEDEN